MQQLETISRYKIEKILGKGAAGTVYKAYDPVINQTVAIKVIHKQLLEQDESGEQLKRFRNEVLAGRRLKHPNIVSIYEYGEEGDSAFIIMEYVEGQQLKDFLDKQFNFDLDAIHKLMQQLLSALNYAHKQGVVHRDIKPANILVMHNWQILVADFGIAHIDNSSMTHTGMIMGTPNYMSPEQCLGEHIDFRTDIFSAGVVLYYLLTGKKPFESETMMGTIQKILNVKPISPSLLNHHVSPSLNDIITRALAKNPNDRFQSALEFSEELTKAINEALLLGKTATEKDKTIISPNNFTSNFIARNDIEEKFHSSDTIIKPNTASIKPITKLTKFLYIFIIGVALPFVIVSTYYFSHLHDNDDILNKLLSKYKCSVLVKDIFSDGKISLRGYVEETELNSFQKSLSELPSEVKLDSNSVRGLSNSFCKIIDVLSTPKELNEQKKLGLIIDLDKQNNHFVSDDFLEMSITMPSFDGYLYVDYFQLNGHVLHLYPTTEKQIDFKMARSLLSIGQSGQEKRWQISPPFGAELISVIASSIPLFNELRNEDEPADAYLYALKNLESAKNMTLTSNYLIIETSP